MLTVMDKNHKPIVLALFLLLSLATIAICGDLNAFYSMDYDGFWKHWNKVKNDAISCTDPQKTSVFFSNALETLGNAEVSEANAEVIENLAVTAPECFLKGLHRQIKKNQEKFIKAFLIHPIYSTDSKIEKSLNNIWNNEKFRDLKTTYYRLQKNS